MNTIKAKIGHAKAGITRALSFAESLDDSTELSLLEIHLERLNDIWSNFVKLHENLLEFCDEADFVNPEQEFGEYEEKYCLSHSIISTKKNGKSKDFDSKYIDDKLASQHASFIKQLESKSSPSSKSVQLPVCIIPTFYGDYKDWPGFKDLFTGTIDRNPAITATQKFQYLKSFLGGDAATLIKHLPVSENNYIEAWEKLENRFDKKQLIVQSFIQAFLSLPSSSSTNIQSLRKLADGADETIRGLKALGSTTRDPWLIFILLQKLDHETKQAWAEEVGTDENSTIHQFLEFLETRCSCLESCYSLSRPTKSISKGQYNLRSHMVEISSECPKCKDDHLLSYCQTFSALGIEDRRKFVKEMALCFNCLRHGHASNKCRSNNRCRICNSRHHTLVHPTLNAPLIPSTSNNSNQTEPQNNSSSSHNFVDTILNCHSLEPSRRAASTILPTAVVKTRDKQGVYQNIRVLLDTGSQVSFITENMAQRLGLSRKKSRIPIVGIASTSAGSTNGLVTLNLHSRFNSDNIDIDCFVISKLTALLPPQTISNFDFTFLQSSNLADPNFNEPGPIDVLIGSDKVFSIIKGSSTPETIGIPNSIPTIFGWVIAGSCQQRIQTNNNDGVRIFCTQLDYSQEFDLERFWRIEEVHHESFLSVDEQRAEEHFATTHHRNSDGRYIVQLPFKTNANVNAGNSFRIALNRLYSIERKFLSDTDLKNQYTHFLNEYLSLGHMEEIPRSELGKSACHYYLPHHAVFKGNSSTTKVRVVFDGSVKSHNSLYSSLNESLLVGPTIQRDIFSICLRCRRYLYIISGDIEKMYRQILVSPNHTNFQRIVWRETPESPIKHFRLLTVTYGTSAAPFLAVRSLKQLALDSTETHPLASSIILNDFYVDDVITGADTIEEVISIRKELVDLLKSAGFNLRKWTTNCWPLLLALPEDQRELSPVEFEESSMIKVLGLQWCPSKDCFSFKVNFPNNTICTKRRILADASRIFDPLGFIAPVIVAIKIFFQDLWRAKLNWDDEIPQELAQRWTIIRDELHFVESINIPRIIWKNKDNKELHAFCDASLNAYAAVVYCRSVSVEGTVTTSLVAAKSKVAPLKILSLPRLELCGALLLTRLVNKIKFSLQDENLNVFAWTDSSIVLHWLSAPPKNWSVFVGNRTSEILSSIPLQSWNHVRSPCNPADVASRGIPPSKLAAADIWWMGPPWLGKRSSEWPESRCDMHDIPVDQLEERKSNTIQVCVSNINPNDVLEKTICNSSNWIKSVRVVAYIYRFLTNCRRVSNNRKKQALTTEEISSAETQLIKYAQCSSFALEIDTLQRGKALPSRNKLIFLAPFLDSSNVLRVGGRLRNSDLSYNEKHPIILCKSHSMTKLLIQYYHKHHLHAGVSLMFAILKQKFYVLGCRNLLRKVVHECVICFRHRKNAASQLMGDLPAERVRYARPFSKVGCDYAGPYTIRLARGRNPKFVKAYIVLFVCFVTKGIHIELVGDLSSNAFLLALDRFISRRGKPTEIWSDNGTNFHGAKRMLGELYELLLSQQHQTIIINHLSKDHIAWKFIPPSSPHFGGLWEAGVKSVKMHLKRVIGDNRLTYEEMYTLLTKIECLLNSRPMWQTSDFEPIALTPSHFMIGESYSALPFPELTNSNISIRTNWYHLQSLMQGFWKRWHQDYLTSLQNRPKWQKSERNLQINDIVLVKEPNLPPSKWILGRIVKLHLGKDKKCRVVTVHTQFGDYVRPVVKIAPLPVSERPESSRGGCMFDT